MRRLIQSLKYSLRLCLKTPINTVLCILVLAGSIALVTSMFRLSSMAFFWSYPYKDSDRVMLLQNVTADGRRSDVWRFNAAETIANGKSDDIFSTVMPVLGTFFTLRNGEENSFEIGAFLPWDFDRIFGVQPILGRTFTAEDARPGAEPVILIGEKLWHERFNADPNIVGKTFLTGRISRTIVGVMPASFDFPSTLSTGSSVAWLPYEKGAVKQHKDWVQGISLYGVVKRGVSVSAAERRFSETAQNLAAQMPDEMKGIVGGAFSPINGNYMPEGFQIMIGISAACSLLVLLMGSGIVSGLLTARYSGRVQELAIRSALGATRRQIVGQMLAEFALISGISVILGLLIDLWMESMFFEKYYASFHMPEYAKGVDPLLALVFVAGVMCLVTLVSAALPAVRASGADLSAVMRESTRTGSSLRVTKLSNFVIVTQVAMACVVLAFGLMVGLKIRALHTEEKFYDPNDYLCAIVSLDNDSDENAHADTMLRLVRELESTPGIEKAGISTEVYNNSTMQWGAQTKVWIDGRAYENDDLVPQAMYRVVSPGYFKSLNVPILAGRDFTYEDDRNHQSVAAVTDTFARQEFGTTDVLGKGIRMWNGTGPLYTIVAVVPDLYNGRHDPRRLTGFFVPYASNSWSMVPVYVKGRGAPELYEKPLRAAIRKVCPHAVVTKLMNMGEMKDYHGWGLLLQLIFTFFTAFGVSALILAAAGLYGVISFSVNMRRLEMGIRLALGASPRRLAAEMARRGLAYVAVGMIVGAAVTFCLKVLLGNLHNQLFDGWQAYAFAYLAVAAISTAAVLIPALRGASVEPAAALRDE
jgi:predicted permease